MPTSVHTLIALVGHDDPFAPALVGEAARKGPVLAVLDRLSLDRLLILFAPDHAPRAMELEREARSIRPELFVEQRVLSWNGSADAMLAFRTVLDDAGATSASYENPSCAVCLASFMPEVRAAWLELALDPEYAFHMIDVRLPARAGDDAECSWIHVRREPMGDRNAVVHEPKAGYGSRASTARGRDSEQDVSAVARACGIVGEHPSLVKALDLASVVAAHDVPILIQGETGTGKGLLARFIHCLSGRPAGQLVAVNCGALPENLIESILFGHTKGSFTGATADRVGKFEAADGGTLFLDEIGELPLELQPKLLRVLEDGVVEPLGARQGRKVNVRIVAATNRDLQAAMAERQFREDLYYRLTYAVVHLPALRDRRSDVTPLALHMLDRINRALRQPKRFAPETLAWLERQEWRGNVRDLENVVGRSALMAKGDVLEPSDILLDSPSPASGAAYRLPDLHDHFSIEDFLRDARHQLIERALAQSGGNQAAAARLLGISPQAISRYRQESA